MDEFEVRTRARRLIAEVGPCSHGDYSPHLQKINAKLKRESLDNGESGYAVSLPSTHLIVVNDRESPERQNFTICHEIAHIELALPSNHSMVPSWAPVKRDENERLCDVFASELLMPMAAFRAKSHAGDPSAELIVLLAESFHVSFPAAASRFAFLASIPFAYITMSDGWIRHAERSTSLRRMGAWIAPRSSIPKGSVANQLREAGQNATAVGEIAQDIWFQDWPADLSMSELARHYGRVDATIALVWFSEEDAPLREFDRFGRPVEEDSGLAELTGELPWPVKSRRR